MFCGRRYLYGAILFIGKGKIRQDGFCRRYFSDNSTVFNESDSFLNMEKHRYLVLGISYLTFKSVQMIMEIRDGMIKTYKPFRYIQFLLFFPTISSGPIDRYRRFEKISSIRLFVINMLIFWEKASKIFCRFLYKFIIGYYFGQVLLPVVGRIALQHGGISWALVGYMYVYSMYLFLILLAIAYLQSVQAT